MPDDPNPAAAPAGAFEPPDPPDEKLTPARLVSRFLLIPILVTVVCVAIFLAFGLLSYEPRTPAAYLQEIKAHSGERRWEAAFGLSRLLENPRWQAAFGFSKRIAGDATVGQDERLVRETAALFEEAKGQDPRIRRYLALALGRLGNPLAAESLLGGLDDEDPETQIHSMWALGALRERRAVPALIQLLREHRDPGVRKMAAYTLGALGDPAATAPLAAALEDTAPDVGWNAAIALARLGDGRAAPVLLHLLDPAAFAPIAGMSEEQKRHTTIEAIRALAALEDPAARGTLEELRSSSPDLRVRQAAIEALQTLEAR
jgi:HEAT repeat protein